MSFLAPHYLWLFLPILLVLIAGGRNYLLSTLRTYKWLILALMMTVIALSRPVMSKEQLDLEERGSDIIIAVDLSYSMQADDIKPTRLEAAKMILSGLIEENSNNRYAIIGYTTSAIILSPLTNDKALLLHLFSGLNTGSIMTKGTVLMPALKLARKMSKSKKALVVLLTDGGDEQNYEQEASYARENALVVNVVMLATYHGSTLRDRNANIVKDSAGHIVVTSRNDAIAMVASRSGGSMVESLSSLQRAIAAESLEEFTTNTKLMQYKELFYYFITLAILFSMFAFTNVSTHLKRLIAPILLLVGVSSQASLLSSYYESEGRSLYQQEKYLDAADNFAKVDGSVARYNEASSYYKAGEYEKALEGFRFIKSNNPEFKARLYYNMGNCFIRLQEFKKAREMFVKSLSLAVKTDVQENLAFIMRAEEQEHLLTGQQEGKKRAQDAETKNQPETGKKKEGGGSNQQSDADGTKGAGGKKMDGDEKVSFAGGKSRLSSRQYELINQRSVNETKPW